MSRIWGELGTREWTALALAALLASCLSTVATLLESNLIQIRPGYEYTHLGLFVCTWAGAIALTLPLALGLGAPQSELRWSSGRDALGLVSVLAALGLHWADRSFLYDIHLGVHLWARACSLILMVSGVALLGSRLRWGVREGLAAALVFVLPSAYFLLASAPNTDMVFRSRVGQGELGRTLLRIRPLALRSSRAARDPRLDFPRGHEIATPRPVKNLLLITVDTLRADAIDEMPRLSAFAERGMRFERVYAPSSGTTYSLPPLFAGRNVSELDWELVSSDAAGRELTAREVTARAGGEWLQFSVLAAPTPEGGLVSRLTGTGRIAKAALDDGLFYFRPPAGRLHRDFDVFEMVPKGSERRAGAVVDRALAHIEASGEGAWFEWVHLFDPHDYDASSSQVSRARYLEQVAAVDEALGRFFDSLDASGRLADTAILITADHGEAFGEHGHRGHRSSLYEEQVRVPLILVGPGIQPLVSQQLASVIDVAPTLSALAGASAEGFSGLNLLSIADGRQVERPVFMSQLWYARGFPQRRRDVKAVVWGSYKLIWKRSIESLELYDLEADPAELHSLVPGGHHALEDLQGLLRDYVSRAESQHPLP